MNYQSLERTIGHQFADITLLDLAMTHPSYALQHKCQDNQRLEFLGDAVLEICVSRVIYHKYPKLREGQLTRKRAALVCEANLAKAATRLGLGSYLKLDRGEEVVGGRENPSILADTMEAVIAAVYLDAGMEKAAQLVDLAMDGYETSEKGDRDAKSALATRFELRAPNPKTNTYLVLAAAYMAMLDGIKAALTAEKTPKELETSLSKKYGEEDFYLEKDREYRSERDVFEDFTEEERQKLFGRAPATVWENLQGFADYPEKVAAISGEGVITPISLESYKDSILSQWKTELHNRIIPNYMGEVRECVRLHGEDATDYDIDNWLEIQRLRVHIAKNSLEAKCLLSRAAEALDNNDFALASDLQIELSQKMELLRARYLNYKRNLF